MKNIYIALIGIVVGLAGVLAANAYASTSFNGTPSLFFIVATSTSETVGSSSGVVLATSTGRTFARIANTQGNAITCIYDNGAPATINNGFIIAASSTFEMNQLNEPVYTGTVSCISDTGSADKIYVEANQ
jgi:hypothetical protein